jgi:hypothetical protein
MIKWFLSLFPLISCITFNDLHMLNDPCIPRMKLSWSWCMISLICCWIQFANVLLRILACMFIKNICLQLSFFVVSLSSFVMSVTLASQNVFGSVPSFCMSWKSLRRVGISSSLNVWYNSAVNLSDLGLFFWEILLVLQFHCLV